MSPGRPGRARFLTVGVTVAALLSGCSPATVARVAPTTAPPPPITTSPAPSSYSSTSFVAPFDIAPPVWLDPKPTVEQSTFVTWEATGAPAVRILAPASLYPPGEKKDSAVPADYGTYLLGLSRSGAHLSDEVTITVGGRPGRMLTATTTTSLDGVLGCPVQGMLSAACYGLQPQYRLRIVVTQVNGRTLLLWVRTGVDMSPGEAAEAVGSFESMVASLRFVDRPVQSATAPSGTVVDGSYRMTVSWPRVASPDARCVGGAEGSSRQVIYDLSLSRGSLEVWLRVGGTAAKRELGMAERYSISGRTMTFAGMTVNFAVDGHSLTLSNLRGGECGDVAIWTTKPWIRQ